MKLLEPTLDLLPAYVDALERGWSPDNTRGAEAAREELGEIRKDPAGFVAHQVDREAKGPPVRLADGTLVPRLPGYRLWIWDEGFCGSIGFRWQPGTSRLPAHVLGHIGYAVVPWKRGHGYATQSLGLMRDRVHAEGLRYADLTATLDNRASQRVIVANGGFALERFEQSAHHGAKQAIRYRWYTGQPRPLELVTERLVLRQWREADHAPFRAMNADARVMAHFPRPLAEGESDALALRSRNGLLSRGWGLWAIERRGDGRFLGFAGLAPAREEMPFAPAVEIGWRLAAEAWGEGYGTEAAREALRVAFDVLELSHVVAYAAAGNERSIALMGRIGMREDTAFDHPGIAAGEPTRRQRLFRLAREGA